MPKLKLTLDEYIKSPAGKGNVTGSQYLAEVYKSKFESVMLRVNGNIEHKFFTENGQYFILLKVPSETVPKFTYDVVFKFSPKSNTASYTKTLHDYTIQFFSNDPAFTYTFAYVYNESGILVSELLEKLPSEVIKLRPKERNPFGVVNFAKILYFGLLYIRQHGFLDKHYFEESNLRIRSWADFSKLITPSGIKAIERMDAANNDPLYKNRLLKRGVKSGGNANKVVKHIGKVKTTITTNKRKSNHNTVKTTKRR